MKKIIQALSFIDNILDRKTFKQLGNLVEAILSMTGRVTMLGMSRWSESGGSYRTIQRFFGLPDIPWERMNWLVSRKFLQDNDDHILITGDEVVVTKSGKETFGVGRFFLLFRVKWCRVYAFYP
ncbi:MAG: transposase [Mariprofundaceae bacterium]|nr:transposase [Mariprofundaceae bacterium]